MQNAKDDDLPSSILNLLAAVSLSFTVSSSAANTSFEADLAKITVLYSELSKNVEMSDIPPAIGQIGMMHLEAKHKCAVLGGLLGVALPDTQDFQTPDTRRKIFDAAKLLPDDDDDVLFAVHVLDRWISYAKVYSDRSYEQNAQDWNLNCIGDYLLPRSARLPTKTREAWFEVSDDGRRVWITGPFNKGLSSAFAKLLQENPSINQVYLGSGGGSLRDAMEVGRLIKGNGIETLLTSNCYSACPLAFLGGNPRWIATPARATLGFHEVSTFGIAVSRKSKIYQDVREYAQSMGADGDKVLAFMMAASPADMHYPDFVELCDSKVATLVRTLCFSDQ